MSLSVDIIYQMSTLRQSKIKELGRFSWNYCQQKDEAPTSTSIVLQQQQPQILADKKLCGEFFADQNFSVHLFPI